MNPVSFRAHVSESFSYNKRHFSIGRGTEQENRLELKSMKYKLEGN